MTRVRGTSVGLAVVLLCACLSTWPQAGASARPFAFYATQSRSGEPVRWNPCAAITYRINTNSMAGAADVRRVRAAVAEAAAASGIRFVYVGRTGFVPDNRYHPVPTRVRADVVITWAHRGAGARRSSLLPRVARLAGVGGYAADPTNQGFRVARSGFVIFDADHIFAMSTRKQYVVALHELGHLLGLDDVGDRRQVMYRQVLDDGPTHYGAGDVRGLRRLGRGAGCLSPAPAPRRPTVVRSGDRLRIATVPVASVSGRVDYTLSSPELGGEMAHASTPRFSMPLAELARRGRAGKAVTFQIRAANRVGATASRAADFRVPAAVLTVEPVLMLTPHSLDIISPHAVLNGTDVDVTDQLRVSTHGTVVAYKNPDGTSVTALYEHILYFGHAIMRYEIAGTVTVEGPGLSRTFDLSGIYRSARVPPDHQTVPPPTNRSVLSGATQ